MPEVSIATLKGYFANGKVPRYSNHEDLIDTLIRTNSYGCYATTGAQVDAIPNNAWTTVNWSGTEYWDYGGCHSPTVNPERVIAPTDGIYDWNVSFYFEPNSIGVREGRIMKSTGLMLAISIDVGNNSGLWNILSFNGKCALTAGQYMYFQAYQSTGVSLDISAGYSQFHKIGDIPSS